MRYVGPTDFRCAACRKGDTHTLGTHERFKLSYVPPRVTRRRSSRPTRNERILECGYEAYAREEDHYNYGGDR